MLLLCPEYKINLNLCLNLAARGISESEETASTGLNITSINYPFLLVAVFVMGQAWQFKNWPWGGNPTVIFSKICAFHFKWDDANLDKNIANWACQVIPLSRNQRHLDRARLKTFWDVLDR